MQNKINKIQEDLFGGTTTTEPPKPGRDNSDKWISELVGALTDPIIVMPGGWGDDVPEWVKNQITMERLIENMRVVKNGGDMLGTDAEVMWYLSAASLMAPMNEMWAHIYMYLFTKEMRVIKKEMLDKEMIVETLSDYDNHELLQLKAWIYKKRAEHRKEEKKAENGRKKEEKKQLPIVSAKYQEPLF